MVRARILQSEPQTRANLVCYDIRFEISNIVIGETVSLVYWDLHNYLSQWEEGIKRINSHSPSCLITSIEKKGVLNQEEYDSVLRWLVLYKKITMLLFRDFIFTIRYIIVI
jgi:hypothetical protein